MPRLDEMWPPVRCTASTVNSRISRQSCRSSSFDKSRRSRGSFTRSRKVIFQCSYYGRVLDLSRRAAVVTGATGNLGASVVRMFLERGAHVALPVRDLAKGESLRASLGDLAGTTGEPHLIVETAEPST